MEWVSIQDRLPQVNDTFKTVVLCYRDDEDDFWEAHVLHIDNLGKCDWGEAYWMPLPQPSKTS